MTSASHGFKTRRNRGIASKTPPPKSLWVVTRFWGAHAASRLRTFSPTLLEPETDGFGEAAETRTRAAYAPPESSDEFGKAPTNWALRSFEDKYFPAAALAVAGQILFARSRRP